MILKAKNIMWFNSDNYYDKWFCNLYGNIEVLNYPIGISIVAKISGIKTAKS